MSLSISQLYTNHNQSYELFLVAGQKGLNHDVSWVQVTEDISYSSFLRPNVMAFTTGIGKGNNVDWLKQFIASLIQMKAAGLVINIGKYINMTDIDDTVKKLCDEEGFPLFTMPWKIRLADITQDWLYALFSSTHDEYETIEAWKSLLFTEKAIPALELLQRKGWNKEGTYNVVVTSVQGHEGNAYDGVCKTILNDMASTYFFFCDHHIRIIILTGYDDSRIKEFVEQFLCRMEEQGEDCFAGSSLTTGQLLHLRENYRQAEWALKWGRTQGKKYCHFGDMGIYAFLSYQEQTDIMYYMQNQSLGALLQYDRDHNGCLYKTLVAYLRHDGSLQAAAAELYTHRNTVAYRMHKIEQLLPYDLTNGEGRFQAMLACHIHHFLECK
ncbi:MAG: PucR family transcriptional regulator [Megasphaera sp.]|jgi:hypothetical protein|nr:PucR family transcriptional regulator [Megasphaera sp.]MCI1247853.1 PucR family transcriptional regulator [Megasphaera sp.]